MLGCALFTPALHGATVNIQDFLANGSDRNISPAEFNNAQNSAGDGGVINFNNTTYIISGTLVINKNNLIINGRGKNQTTLQREDTNGSTVIFLTSSNDVTIQNMRIRGTNLPSYQADLYVFEGARVRDGVEAAIRITGGSGLRLRSTRMDTVSVGIEYNTGLLPAGLQVRNCDFQTGRGIINARDGRRPGQGVSGSISRRFAINGLRFSFILGHGNRGITFDYGNENNRNPSAGSQQPVNAKNSVIRNGIYERVAFFTVDINRLSRVDIYDNEFNGAGAGTRTSFVHSLHFEDNTEIEIYDNVLRQQPRNSNNIVLSSRSFAFTGASADQQNPTARFENNICTGIVDFGITGSMRNWRIKNNQFNTNNVPRYYINGFRDSTGSASGNTRNGNPIPASRIRFIQ